ncbi:MAG: RNA-binding S4 domain-containing protein [Nitrospinota bacterium]|nr:RNA-binding S4 domain-containing protein [Nitrospinota bacterium]
MEEFNLGGKPFIELHNLLKAIGWCESGGMAKMAIAEGNVKVDGEVELRKGCKIRIGQVVTLGDMSVKVI